MKNKLSRTVFEAEWFKALCRSRLSSVLHAFAWIKVNYELVTRTVQPINGGI